MLNKLYTMCFGRACPSIIEEDERNLRKRLRKGQYDIQSYVSKDPLYKAYSTMIQERAEDFSERICREALGYTYIRSTLDRTSILTLTRMIDEDDTIRYVGFAQSSVSPIPGTSPPSYELKIETICTEKGLRKTISNNGSEKSLGTAIMESIIQYAKRDAKIYSVTLNSILDAVEFYKRLGFTMEKAIPIGETNSIDDGDNLYVMTKQLGGRRRRRGRTHRRRSRKS